MNPILGRPVILFGALVLIVAITPFAYIFFHVPGLLFSLAASQVILAALGFKAIRVLSRTKKHVATVAEEQQRWGERLDASMKKLVEVQKGYHSGHSVLAAKIAENQKKLSALESLSKELPKGIETMQRKVRELESASRAQGRAIEQVHELASATKTNLNTSTRKVIRHLDRRASDQIVNTGDLLAIYKEDRSPHSLPKLDTWAASPDLLRFMWDQVMVERRTSIIECGSGISTVLLAQALSQIGMGTVVALEHDQEYADRTTRFLRERGLEKWATVVYAPLKEFTYGDEQWQWYDRELVPEGHYDLAVIDGPPSAIGPQSRFPALPVLYESLLPGAMVILDDFDRDSEQTAGKNWIDLYPDMENSSLRHMRGTLVLTKEKSLIIRPSPLAHDDFSSSSRWRSSLSKREDSMAAMMRRWLNSVRFNSFSVPKPSAFTSDRTPATAVDNRRTACSCRRRICKVVANWISSITTMPMAPIWVASSAKATIDPVPATPMAVSRSS